MKITNFNVDGFGIWKGLSTDQMPGGMTVFYGRNEAGKTTLMDFVRSVLFGYPTERRDRYVPPVHGGLAGGRLFVDCPTGQYEIERHIDPSRLTDTVGDLTVVDQRDGSVHARAQLASLLSDLDESIFSNVFAIGLQEIQELSSLNSTEASDLLYKLTSGLDRVSLVDVMRELKKQRGQMWSPDPKQKSKLTELVEKRRDLSREINELMSRSRRWSKIAVQSNEANRRIEEIEKNLGKFEQKSKIMELAMQVSDRWQSRRLLDEQISAIGQLPDSRSVSVKELDKINEQLTKNRERLENVRRQRRSIKREANRLPINRQLWSYAPRIEAMCEHLPWIDSLNRQSDRLRGEVNTLQSSLGGEVTGLGSKLNLKSKEIKDLTNQAFSTLRSVAEKIVEQKEALNRAEDEKSLAKSEVDQLDGRVRKTFADTTDGTLPTSLEESGKLVNRLRRQIELEEKIDKLHSTRRSLEMDIDNVVNEQVLPVNKLVMIGIIFILGVLLTGFGVLSTISTFRDVGFLMMVLGAGVGLFSLALKHHWERVAAEELDDFRQQFEGVRQQIKRAKAERDEIERHLPDGIGEWGLQLQDAESRLHRLEELAPLESKSRAAKARYDEAERVRAKMEHEVESAERRWRETLRSAGLPDSVSPNQLTEISQRTERITGFHSRIEQYETELLEREREMGELGKRINSLLVEVGFEYENKDPAQRLEQLRGELAEQRRLIGQRKEMAGKYRKMRKTFHSIEREIDRLLGAKQKMLSAVGVETEEDFRELEVKHAQRRKLLQKRERLSEQITAALGDHIDEKLIAGEIEQYGHTGLEKRWESLQSKIEELQEEENRLHQHRGELLQEIKVLSEDSRLDEARLELAAIETEIQQCKHQWQVNGVSSQMLETIREAYESQRQPETLKEASRFLERLTDGHYNRIWTRMIGQELFVDSADGQSLPVEMLSRGTREAVYLGLRLALVTAYARRGIVLPMILDDVLVNFDSDRALAAATVLRDFANSGYQILMFTCHDHMRDMFDSIDVDVLILPTQKDVLDHNARPTPFRRIEQAVETINEAVIPDTVHDEDTILEPIARRPIITLATDEHDPELEYELDAISRDEREHHQWPGENADDLDDWPHRQKVG